MKKYKPVIAITSVIFFCLLLAGCNKLTDFLLHHPDADIRVCSIQKISTSTPAFGDHRDASFVYNNWGDPVRITIDPDGTGNPNREFRYDDRHRLTDYIGAYTLGGNEFWRRLVYDGSGKIIRDTVFIFGDPVRYDHLNSYVNFYEYDIYKRISKVTKTFPFGIYPTEIFLYSYDALGNLIRPGTIYDDKINIHRTNKIWMFLDRDYSLNNPYTADIYNNRQLPTKITIIPYTLYFLNIPYFEETLITYSCK